MKKGKEDTQIERTNEPSQERLKTQNKRHMVWKESPLQREMDDVDCLLPCVSEGVVFMGILLNCNIRLCPTLIIVKVGGLLPKLMG